MESSTWSLMGYLTVIKLPPLLLVLLFDEESWLAIIDFNSDTQILPNLNYPLVTYIIHGADKQTFIAWFGNLYKACKCIA